MPAIQKRRPIRLAPREARPSISLPMKRFPILLLFSLLIASAFAGQADSAKTASLRFPIPPTDDGLPGAGPLRRADWFQKVWSERRTLFSEHARQDQRALVFLGDSITQKWGMNLGGCFTGIKTANRGISGDTSRGVLFRLREDVLLLHPAGIVLLVGTNDIADKASPETIAGNVRLILDALRLADPKMPVALCEVLPSSASKDRPAETIRQLNALYAGLVKDYPQATLVATWAVFANPAGDAKSEEFPDLLHPNEAGYAKWAAALRPVLAKMGFAPAPSTP